MKTTCTTLCLLLLAAVLARGDDEPRPDAEQAQAELKKAQEVQARERALLEKFDAEARQVRAALKLDQPDDREREREGDRREEPRPGRRPEGERERPDRPEGPPRPDGPFRPDGPPFNPRGERPDGEGPLRRQPNVRVVRPEEEMQRIRAADPEMARFHEADRALEMKTAELVEQLRRSEGPDRREALRETLTKVVGEHFELRQQRRELEVKRLEAQLERLRQSVRQRAEAREQIVQRRLGELLGERDDIGF